MQVIPVDLWAAQDLTGRNLQATSLADELGDDPTLLVFLRHLG